MGPRWLAATVVGRERELAALLDAVRQPPAVVLVEGEAGIGKTRLVHELFVRMERLEPVRVRRLVGHCHPLREPFPFGPFVDALARAGGQNPPEPLPPITGALRQLLPELGHWLPAAPPPAGDPGIERHRVFRGVRELLAALGPTVLVIEDVHWVDQGTAELLRYLAHDLPPRLSLVLTLRPEDATPGRGIETVTARHVRVSLAPLPVEDVCRMAAAILRTEELSAAFAARLHERTGGLPFAVEELLRLLPSRAADAGASAATVDGLAVPAALRDHLRDRLGRLHPAARRIVDAAAVLAVPSQESVLAAVAGLRPAAGARALGEALHHAALWPSGSDGYGFRHALASDAAYEALPAPVRRRLHQRAERVLRGLRPTPLAQLAHHARLGGRIAAARRYAEQAADQAVSLGDNATATEFLRGALEAPGLPRATRIRLTVKLARAATLGLAHTEVAPLLEHMLGTEQLPAGQRGELRLSLGLMLSNQLGDVAAGTEQIRRAATELRARPDLAARALAALALPDHTAGPVGENLAALEAAMRLLPQVADPVVRTAVLVNRASTLLCVGDPRAWHAVEDLPAAGRDPAETQQLHRGLCNVANNCITLGHYEAARRYLARGQAFECKTTTGGYTPTLTNQLRMHLDFATGKLGEVRRQARDLAAWTDIPPISQDATMMLGVLALLRGDAAGAERRIRAACPASAAELRPRSDAMTITWLLRVLLALGRPVDAVTEAEPVLAAIRTKGAWVWAAELLPAITEALLTTGRLGCASELVDEFAAGVADKDAPLSTAALAWCRAMLSGTGHLDAHQRYAELPRPYEAALALEGAGRDGTPDHVLTALETYDRLGATADAARCRGRLRAAGHSVPCGRGRPSYGGALSPREQQVLDLVRRGRTNREIAAALFLSERTVEGHVARLLRKLGLRGRRDLWTTAPD